MPDILFIVFVLPSSKPTRFEIQTDIILLAILIDFPGQRVLFPVLLQNTLQYSEFRRVLILTRSRQDQNKTGDNGE